MNLISIRIITSQMNEMIAFYEKVTGKIATRYTPDFAEIKTSKATLAIGSTRTLQFFGDDEVAEPAHNRSVIIELIVDDVDRDYERISIDSTIDIVQHPTVMPWGNRSLLMRDCDGNLVNLFTPVSQEAKNKFEEDSW